MFITHEMDTVLKIADSVARLDRGSIAESGRLVDLLTDPASTLGAALRPQGTASDATDGQQIWQVVYDSPDVPADWIARASIDLGAPIAVLGASVQEVHGVTVGSATVGIPAELGDRVTGVLARYGLSTGEQRLRSVA